MYFLAWKLSDVIEIIKNAIRGLCGILCEALYPLIASLYDVFINLGKLAYVDDFAVIYNKISLIIGIFMVFRVTFWLIESLINPDTMSDKEKNPGKIIQKVLTSVVLLAITPTIFKYAFDIQTTIIESSIIENIMSVGQNPADSTTTGRFLSSELFENFYTPTVYEKNGQLVEVDSNCTQLYTGEGPYSHAVSLRKNGKLNDLNNECLTQRINGEDKGEYEINFNGFFAVGVGAFVFWMMLMYCISLGTRYVQLIYLQVIAPIPIMCYLAPGKDNMFSKWIKQCTTTYLDLFIRIAIINFVMILCNIILSNGSSIIGSFLNDNWIIEVFLVLGLLTFAKKAPELIQELLPKSVTKASGDFGLSWKKRTDAMVGGKYIHDMPKRAFGAGVVGLNTVQRNARKNIGKAWDAYQSLISLPSPNDTNDPEIREKREKAIKEKRKEFGKWVGRSTFGALYSGVGGVRRGLMTTDSAGRRKATENAVNRTQANQKLHDAGYGSSIPGLFTEQGGRGFVTQATDQVRGFFGKDQVIGDLVDITDTSIEGTQRQIYKLQEDLTEYDRIPWNIQPSKVDGDKYVVTNEKGEPAIPGKMYYTEQEVRALANSPEAPRDADDIITKLLNIAKLQAKVGKLKGKSKALKQKEEEEKSKQGK